MVKLITSLLLILCGLVYADSKIITVSLDENSDYKTVQEAINSIPDNNDSRTEIHIRPGVYAGQIHIPRNKNKISFIGENATTTSLTYNYNVFEDDPNGIKGSNGIGVIVDGADFYAENITFNNTCGDRGQALALRLNGDRAIIKNCRLLGWQDTLRPERGRHYFKNCYIEGRVDFIYGGGQSVFYQCNIHSKNGGYVTAASTSKGQKFGFVFIECKLTGSKESWDPATAKPPQNKKRGPFGKMALLGRPWRGYAHVAFINCWMDDHIIPEGWNIIR